MKILKPSATMISHTVRPLDVIYRAFRTCTSPIDADLIGGVDDEEKERFIRKRLKPIHAHESTLEHVYFTFEVICSRACSHQLVRHRIANYSQQSQRYVSMADMPVILPDAKRHPTVSARQKEEAHLRTVEKLYGELLAAGYEPEEARRILPNETATRLLITRNCRDLRHFLAERLCHRAQDEIRQIAGQMLYQVKQVLPCVFDRVAEPCVKLGRCVEERPCGDRPWSDR